MNKESWKRLLIITAKTWCQAFTGVTGANSAARGFDDVNWRFAIEAAAVASMICFFWNLGIMLNASLKETNDEMTEEEAFDLLNNNEEIYEDLEEYDEDDEEEEDEDDE